MRRSDLRTGSRRADPAVTARAVFHAAARFHEPGYARDRSRPDIKAQARFEAVVDLVVRGLRA
ncbi:hypothetical protein [Streptomyces sp. HM190]|uniref:hypothetical protein n=1 Tax=Streptomyces sp. HM190 TaxID=2695266 RepID=UPI002E2A241B|nr:hypothetical protein [Streptomyces sp. HM190]